MGSEDQSPLWVQGSAWSERSEQEWLAWESVRGRGDRETILQSPHPSLSSFS